MPRARPSHWRCQKRRLPAPSLLPLVLDVRGLGRFPRSPATLERYEGGRGAVAGDTVWPARQGLSTPATTAVKNLLLPVAWTRTGSEFLEIATSLLPAVGPGDLGFIPGRIRETGKERQTGITEAKTTTPKHKKKSLRFLLLCTAAAAAATTQPHVLSELLLPALPKCPMASLDVSSHSSGGRRRLVDRRVGHPLPLVRRLELGLR